MTDLGILPWNVEENLLRSEAKVARAGKRYYLIRDSKVDRLDLGF
jgi:hypothetical protein